MAKNEWYAPRLFDLDSGLEETGGKVPWGVESVTHWWKEEADDPPGES